MSGDDGVAGAPDDRDLDAAEYVIGLLTPNEARDLEARAINDPVLAGSILAWQRRLSGPADDVLPVTPPASVWERLEATAGLRQDPVREVRRRPPPQRPVAAWQDPRFWRGTMFASAVCGAAVAFAVVSPKLLVSEPAMAALSTQGASTPAFLVMVTKDGYATVIATAAEVQPGNTLELWELPEGVTEPISLGLLPTTGRLRLNTLVAAGTLLLVSSEPEGGSPTGEPTGPVVYSGRMVRG